MIRCGVNQGSNPGASGGSGAQEGYYTGNAGATEGTVGTQATPVVPTSRTSIITDRITMATIMAIASTTVATDSTITTERGTIRRSTTITSTITITAIHQICMHTATIHRHTATLRPQWFRACLQCNRSNNHPYSPLPGGKVKITTKEGKQIDLEEKKKLSNATNTPISSPLQGTASPVTSHISPVVPAATSYASVAAAEEEA